MVADQPASLGSEPMRGLAQVPNSTPFAPDDLRPRPLWRGELPERGDFHFAVGLAKGSPFVSRVIAVGTASRTNHVGIITQVEPPGGNDAGWWWIVESLSKGVVKDEHRPPPNSTVIRLSEDPRVREAVAQRAEDGASANPHISYDWAAIVRIIVIGLFGRVPYLTFAVIGSPLIAGLVAPWWLALGVIVVAICLLYRVQPWLFTVAAFCARPRKEPTDRLICSAFGRHVIEEVFGGDALPGLAGEEESITSPGDLLQELLHRCDYWNVKGGQPTAHAVLDKRVRGEPRRSVTRVT
jgi:hypothetical protein